MKNGLVLPENEETSDEDIKLINKFTKRNLDKNEVYVFSAILCDNEIDSENEKFTIKSLEKLSQLFIGKTGIIRYNQGNQKQFAKIFSCKTQLTKEQNSLGENYCKLIAKIYIPRNKSNEDLILEIDSGIKEKINIKCSVEKTICSICNENIKTCIHKKNKKYNFCGSELSCYAILENPINVYEWSLDTTTSNNYSSDEFVKTFSRNMKKDESTENTIKKLKDVVNKSGMQKIYKMIESLEDDVSIGRKYVSELRNDVIKHFSFLRPQIDNLSLKKMINVLSVDDLEKMKKRFSNSTMKIQLFSSKKTNVNHEYKI